MSKKNYHRGHRPELEDFMPATYSTALDIGCGEGKMAGLLHDMVEYWGIEPVKEPYDIAIENGLNVKLGLYDEVAEQIPDNYFDLIICADVIEHMIDHDKFLSDIKSKLSKNGVLVGSIPNIRYSNTFREILFNQDWEYKDSGILDRTHLRFFTEKSLRRTLESHGFEIVKFSGINSAFDGKKSRKTYRRAKRLSRLLRLITGKDHSDVQFLQFAFQIKLPS